LGAKIVKDVKKMVMLFSYIVWPSTIKFGIVRGIVYSRLSPILVNFGPLFQEHKFLTADILHISYRSTTKFGSSRSLASRHLVSEFGQLWSWDPAIPRGDMHQSSTDTLVLFCVCFLFVK